MPGRLAGFSLIEVLVAMCVVSTGILALAGLLQAAVRHSKSSQLRAAATLLAQDIADRIRANPAGARLGAHGYELTGPTFPSPAAAPHAACTGESPCEPSALAAADLADWTARVKATLPQGSAWIRWRAAKAPAPDSADVWVGWVDPLTLMSDAAGERVAGCPAAWTAIQPAVRCVHLLVAP